MIRFTLFLTATAVAFGQAVATMSPVRAMPAPVGASQFGNILYPGGTPSFPTALGGTIGGHIPYTGVQPGAQAAGRQRTIVVPYAMPVFAGGGYYGYPQQQQQMMQPNVTVVMPQQQQAPPVVINQHFNGDAVRPVTTMEGEETGGLRVYEATPRPRAADAPKPPVARADDKPNIYLIALKDGTVKQAIGYWADGALLKYVTAEAKIREVALTEVDRNASERLNEQRKLDFQLPSEQ